MWIFYRVVCLGCVQSYNSYVFNHIPCKHLRTYDIVRWYYLHPTKIIIFLLCSIEHCIEEIQFEVNKLCPDVQLQTTTGCFKWFASYDYVSPKSSSISHGDLMAFLKIMVKNCCFMVEWGSMEYNWLNYNM